MIVLQNTTTNKSENKTQFKLLFLLELNNHKSTLLFMVIHWKTLLFAPPKR